MFCEGPIGVQFPLNKSIPFAPDIALAPENTSGLRIAFARGSGTASEIYTMNADGRAQTVLTRDGVADSQPAWSPDGRWIAYMSQLRGSCHIHIIKVATRGSTRLTNDSGMDLSPNWSPDSSKIVFTRQTSTDSDIWIMNADGTRPINITRSTYANEGDPVFSRDGGQIAFVDNPIGAGLNIWTMYLDGSGRRTEITRTNHDIQPDW